MSKYLHRDDAPWGDKVWEIIDKKTIEAAKSQLSARRILHVIGPYGLGVKALPGREQEAGDFHVSTGIPLAKIHRDFSIPVTDIATYEASGLPMDLGVVAQKAIECARLEDTLLLNGSKELGVEGLTNAKGAHSIKLSEWTELGTAAEDVIKAVTTLDDAGFHGPYSLALAPQRYNLLYRKYHQGQMTELDHVRKMASKVVKAPALSKGGVLLNDGVQYASIALGQDLMTGYVGPVGADYELFMNETIALRLLQPKAVCVLK